MVSTLQKPEDKICNMCAETRREDGLEPNKMIALPEKTERKKLTVYVCPDCDSPSKN